MNEEIYLWKDDAVVVIPRNQEFIGEYYSHVCVDTGYDNPEMRYGTFTNRDDGWVHVPIEDFPKTFRAHLLLLGIS